MSTHHILEAAHIDAHYWIDISDDKKWYVTRFENGYSNGGQDIREYQHNYGFASKAGAVKWALRDAKRIHEWELKYGE